MNREQFKRGCVVFWAFFKGMAFAFTGGMTAIPTVENELVNKRGWLTKEEFWDVPPLSQSLPGAISIHNGIQIGRLVAGWFGALMACLSISLIAFGSMILVSIIFQSLLENELVRGAIKGIRAVSIAVLLHGCVNLINNCEKDIFSLAVFLLAILLPLVFGVSTFATILLCGGIGIIWVLTHPSETEKVKK